MSPALCALFVRRSRARARGVSVKTRFDAMFAVVALALSTTDAPTCQPFKQEFCAASDEAESDGLSALLALETQLRPAVMGWDPPPLYGSLDLL